jgi:serine/threonine-protein kinase HipA
MHSSAGEDIATFVDALVFNWLIGGTDAHAKNYSILLGAEGTVRLAPVYDVASILAYSDFDPKKARLAMKIGGRYRLNEIGLREWQKLSSELRLEPDLMVSRARSMAERLPDVLSTEKNDAESSGLRHPVLSRMADAITARARECTRRLSIARDFE